MFEIAVIVFVFSLFFAMFISFTLLILRIVLVIKDKRPLKEALLIVLLPGGTGYYHFYKIASPFKIWYQRLVIVMGVLTLIGSVYIAFLNSPQLASWFFYGF